MGRSDKAAARVEAFREAAPEIIAFISDLLETLGDHFDEQTLRKYEPVLQGAFGTLRKIVEDNQSLEITPEELKRLSHLGSVLKEIKKNVPHDALGWGRDRKTMGLINQLISGAGERPSVKQFASRRTLRAVAEDHNSHVERAKRDKGQGHEGGR